MEYVDGQDEVIAKPAPLERIFFSLTKPALIRYLPHVLDYTNGKAPSALHRCLAVGKAMTPAGHTPGFASPEPGIRVKKSLVLRPQNHDGAGTGYF